ncbi:hypothetical protein COOONC_09748 [Cooperia oncophora]
MKSSSSRPTNVGMTPRQDPLTFEVLPQEGLKNENIEFILGMPLNQASFRMCFPVFDSASVTCFVTNLFQDPLGRDICAYLGNDGIRLVFHPVTQLLRLIEVDNPFTNRAQV